jgi:hypothetical protein
VGNFKILTLKTRKIELDVDFIGGEGPLTVAEGKAISEYITKQKAVTKKASETKKHLIARAEKSNKDYLAGKVKTQEQLEKESENW